jgi:RecG-like helicase
VFSGIVETYDSEKCVNNPLIKVIDDETNKEVVAVYPFDYVPKISDFNRPEYDRPLYGNGGMALKEALLGLHGFFDKQKLIEARRDLKFDELVTCHLACLKAGTTLEKELLSPFKIEDASEASCETRLIGRQEEGEEAQAIKDTINSGNKVCIICSLAYVTAEERNAKVWEFDQSSKVPSVKSQPNISIEINADCPKNYDALKKRKSQICKLCNIRDSKNVQAISNVDFSIQSEKNDLLVIEDADRVSTLQIDFWRRMATCRTLIVSNSKSQMQHQRLSFLCDTHTQEEILYHEMSYRRDGDILGCRNNKFKCLKLINLERDKKMNKKAESYAKELIRA